MLIDQSLGGQAEVCRQLLTQLDRTRNIGGTAWGMAILRCASPFQHDPYPLWNIHISKDVPLLG
jgi:hypothetical protein